MVKVWYGLYLSLIFLSSSLSKNRLQVRIVTAIVRITIAKTIPIKTGIAPGMSTNPGVCVVPGVVMCATLVSVVESEAEIM